MAYLDENANKDTWKLFGRESQIGRLLYSLYSDKAEKKISYPKPPQPKPPLTRKEPPPPPTVVKKAPAYRMVTLKKAETPPVEKIHLIPKRKNFQKILEETGNYAVAPCVDLREKKDMSREKERLAVIRGFQRQGCVPESVQMPGVDASGLWERMNKEGGGEERRDRRDRREREMRREIEMELASLKGDLSELETRLMTEAQIFDALGEVNDKSVKKKKAHQIFQHQQQHRIALIKKIMQAEEDLHSLSQLGPH